MPDAIVIADLEGRITHVNRLVEALSGYSPEELVGRPVEQLVPEGLRSGHVQHRTAYQRSPSVRAMGTHMDIRLRRKDGSEVPVDIALSPMASDQGPLVVASVRDITERKRAEEELLRAEERFRRVVEGVKDYAIFMLDRDGNISTWTPAAERMKGYSASEILGRHFSIFYPQADLDAGKPERVLAAASAAGRNEEEGWRLRKDGSRFWANVLITAIYDQAGKLLGFAKITRDISERKRRDDRIRAVLEVAQATLEGLGEHDLLQLITKRARTLVQADLGMVVLRDSATDRQLVAAVDGRLGKQVRGKSSSADRDLEPLTDVAGGGPSLVVPLRAGERAFGSLAVTNDPGGETFTDVDRELLDLFAAQAAVAIDYLRVRDDLQRLAVLQDRERIGRELHDGAIQALFAVGMSLQAIAMMTGDQALRERLESTVVQIDEVIRDLRNYIFGLRPGLAADRHLGQALRELADQLEQQHGVSCALDVDEVLAARLAGRAGEIIQMAREAISNVGRHAEARTCRLSLRAEPGLMVLEVEDDGRGFVPGDAEGEGWGLRNLRDRAAAMGGSLEISSVLGEGTLVRLLLPNSN